MNKDIRHSVYKLAGMARAIKGMHLYDAQAYCTFTPKKSAEAIGKILR